MTSLPRSKANVLPLALAVLIPMIGIGATQLPVRHILKFASPPLIRNPGTGCSSARPMPRRRSKVLIRRNMTGGVR